MAQSVPVSATRTATTPALILVIDPDPANRRLLTWALSAEGHRVIEGNTTAALAALDHATGRPDLVIAHAGLLGLRPTGSTPLILMTASLSGEMREVARRLGATTSIHRPIYFDELRHAVQQALASCSRATAAVQQRPASGPAVVDAADRRP